MIIPMNLFFFRSTPFTIIRLLNNLFAAILHKISLCVICIWNSSCVFRASL